MEIQEILEGSSTVAVVGASTDSQKPAGEVPAFLKEIGFRVIPVNPGAEEILGEKTYSDLSEIEEPVDVVQVFRPGDEAPDIARAAIEIGAKVVWLQLGIKSSEAREVAEGAGLAFVEDHCMKIESRRFEISKSAAA